jgi:outer membrane protein OmpA-like peptidoglycan-associated protein
MNRLMKFSAMMLVAFMLTACATANKQQTGTGVGAAVGAGVGAILGQAIGHDTTSTLVGAGIGAALGGVAGNQIGAYMDRQEQDLQNAIGQSEAASIQRDQDVLTATFKSDLFFDTNSAQLKPGAFNELSRVADVLNKYPQTTIRVEGHTDTRGDAGYNQQLSERRAESVKNALAQRGVNPNRMQAVGYGESQPISSSDAMNRRVNVVINPNRQN